MPPTDFIYFLSYARDDFYVQGTKGLEEEPYLAKFFKDLRETVRSKAGRVPADRVDFRDTEQLGLGQQWRPAVLDGLQTCRTVVALFTPTFFIRPECGIELGYMLRRRRQSYPEGSQPHDFIIPIVWETGAQIPPALASINYFSARLPAAYKEYGLRVLARNTAFATVFERSIQSFATESDKNRDGSCPCCLPIRRRPTRRYPEPFVAASEGGKPPVRDAIKGPNGVRFAYVAATRDEIGNKLHLEPYGTCSEEWQPSPSDQRVVGMIAPGVAAACRFIPYQMPLDGTFANQLARAHAENALIVLLVNVWSACRIQSTGI